MSVLNHRSTLFELVVECCLAVVFLWAILTQYHNNVIAGIVCVVVAVSLFSLRPSKKDVFAAALAVVIGSLGDMLSVQAGAWVFTNSEFYGIPPWLPVSWACNFLLFRRLSQTLTEEAVHN